MKKFIFVLFLCAALIIPVFAHAAEFKAASNGDYYLNSTDTVSDNLYVASRNVFVMGTAQKDLFTAGGTVSFTGEVARDLAVAGGTVNIGGKVNDDVRVAGGNVSVDGIIGEDLLAFGGSVSVLPNSRIGGSALIAAGNVDVQGTINGPLTVYAGKIYINGIVNGNLIAKGSELTLGPLAVVNGNLNYSAPKEANVMAGAKISGKTNFTKINPPQAGPGTGMVFLGFMTAWWLIKLFTLLIATLIFYYVFKESSKELIKHTVNNFWRELLRGFVLFFIIPIAVIIALFTIIGIIPALIVALVYILMIMLGAVFGGILVAGLISKWLMSKTDYSLDWYTIILGVVVFQLLNLIPFVGWLISAAIFLAGLGALYGSLYIKFEPKKK